MTKISRILGGACIVAAAAIGSGAHAQTIEENWQTCQGGDFDAVIVSCTALIDSGQGDANTRSAEYTYRAIAYEQKNRNDDAIADYRAALELNPSNGGARMGLLGLTQ